MKQVITLLFLALLLVSCGTRKGYFSIEGQFMNLNQGEFYVYSNDGIINGVDTIHVKGGLFALEIPCAKEGTLMIVFPNFTEQPIFAESGESVKIKGDASHLKEMEVSGTEANELMTKFRLATSTSSPPETKKTAEHFIRDNASSPVALYLLRKYFVTQESASSLKKAKELIGEILKEQPKNGNAVKMEKQIKMLLTSNIGSKLPSFTATDIKGNTVSQSLLKGKKAIIYTWANWNYDSENVAQRINEMVRESAGNVAALGISLSSSKEECLADMERFEMSVPTVCDENMFDGALVNQLGLRIVPGNIILDAGGKVIARNVSISELKNYLE